MRESLAKASVLYETPAWLREKATLARFQAKLRAALQAHRDVAHACLHRYVGKITVAPPDRITIESSARPCDANSPGHVTG